MDRQRYRRVGARVANIRVKWRAKHGSSPLLASAQKNVRCSMVILCRSESIRRGASRRCVAHTAYHRFHNFIYTARERLARSCNEIAIDFATQRLRCDLCPLRFFFFYYVRPCSTNASRLLFTLPIAMLGRKVAWIAVPVQRNSSLSLGIISSGADSLHFSFASFLFAPRRSAGSRAHRGMIDARLWSKRNARSY